MSDENLTTLTLTDKERAVIAECIHFAMTACDALDAPDEHLIGLQYLKSQVLGDLDHSTTGQII